MALPLIKGQKGFDNDDGDDFYITMAMATTTETTTTITLKLSKKFEPGKVSLDDLLKLCSRFVVLNYGALIVANAVASLLSLSLI